MLIERHIFGSYSGYTTLARSAGVSSDDARQLEGTSFAFGQTNDRGYLKGLKRANAYFTRVLRGNRRGLTRVFEGDADDNGRPTLLMITAIVSQTEWDSELCGDVSALLEDAKIWRWDKGADVPALRNTYPPPSRGVARKSIPRVLALLSELERQMPARQPIVVRADDFSFDELRALEVLIPATVRGQFTSAYLSLSGNLPVSVNCLAPEADSQTATFRPTPGTPLSPYATFLQQSTSLGNGSLPLGEVMAYRFFGRRDPAASVAPVPEAAMVAMPPVIVIHRTPIARLLLVAVFSCVVAGASGFLAGSRWRPRTLAAQPVAPTSMSASPATSVAAATQPKPDEKLPKTGPDAKAVGERIAAAERERGEVLLREQSLEKKYHKLARSTCQTLLETESLQQLRDAGEILDQIAGLLPSEKDLSKPDPTSDIGWLASNRGAILDLHRVARLSVKMKQFDNVPMQHDNDSDYKAWCKALEELSDSIDAVLLQRPTRVAKIAEGELSTFLSEAEEKKQSIRKSLETAQSPPAKASGD